jgi:hypothetical protein
MADNVTIEPMTEDFIVWRCLHDGPLSSNDINQWPSEGAIPWSRYCKRNELLLLKLTRTYGACAIVARDEGRIVTFVFILKPYARYQRLEIYVFSRIILTVLVTTFPNTLFQVLRTLKIRHLLYIV